MINIKLIGEFKFNKLDVLNRNYIKALTVDCIMSVSIDNKLVYEDWICPLELYFQLLEWNNRIISKYNTSFHYFSDDNGVNPIFSIEFCGNNKWIFKNNLTNNEFNISSDDVKNFYLEYRHQILLHADYSSK